MTYIAKIVWYNDFDAKEEKANLFISGDSYKDVVDKLSTHFGEEDICSVELKPFSPDGFLCFDEPDFDLFQDIVERVGSKVIW